MTNTISIKRAASVVLTTALLCGTATFAQVVPVSTGQGPVVPPVVPMAPQGSAKPADKALVPLKVQVTLTRFNGETKVSSLPFTLWVNANDRDRTTLNVGIQMPVQSGVNSFQYRNVGTSLTCGATSLDDGRYRVDLSIDDNSIAPGKDTSGSASFQSLSTHNYLLLRDGQNAQFLAATDKITGEVTKVEVTVTVLK